MRRNDWLANQLPVGMTEDDFFMRFVTIFQRMADTVVDQIDTLPYMFDPSVAPDNMVRAMAEWIGVDWVDSSLDDRLQREIVMKYSQLIQWRGTNQGLVLLLELLSGGPVEVRDTGGVFPEGESPHAPPHVRLDLAQAGWNRTADLIRIIRSELPATVTFDLWVAGEKIWPVGQGQQLAESASRPRVAAGPSGSLDQTETSDQAQNPGNNQNPEGPDNV
jgi:phage tail-like protein